MGKNRSAAILRSLTILFFLAFEFLWFKDNFPLLRKIPISPAIPLAGLILILVLRALPKLKTAASPFRIKPDRDWAVLALLILLSTALHVPYLIHSDGLMDSDEAIPALQGKHIAEGKIPALYYYSALFQGSLPQHYYALLFRIFGYSVVLAKIAACLAFVVFLVLQFFLVRRLFSRTAAIAVGFFYALPFMHLIMAGFDLGSGFPVVFVLGTVVFTLTAKIHDGGPDRLLAPLGFAMGLAFWTHQISIIFILTSAVFLALRYKLKIRAYARLAGFAAVGMFPLLLSEAYWNFPIVRMLSEGESTGRLTGDKITRGGRFLLDLFFAGPALAGWILLALLGLGLIALAVRSIRKGRIRASALFAVYTIIFAAVYLLSGSSSSDVIRYLYILYLVIPILFASAFFWIRKEALRAAVIAAFFVFLLIGMSGKTSLGYFQAVKDHARDLGEVSAALAATGQTYWKGHYWISYLFDAVSSERLIVASTTTERYPFYQLAYDTAETPTNRIFLRDTPKESQAALEFTEMLRRLGKTFETRSIRDWLLVYGIKGYIFPKNLFFPPEAVPDVVFQSVEAGPSNLVFRFASKTPIPVGGYRLNVEIPGFASKFTPLDPGGSFAIQVPYPPERRVRLKYFLDHQGLVLDPTFREIDVDLPAPPAAPRPDDVDYLAGFGPREQATGKNWEICGKNVKFRINVPLRQGTKIVLALYAPFKFDDPWWHGGFAQAVDILVNGRPYRQVTLTDNSNTLTLDAGSSPFRPEANILELRFRYEMVISVKDHWKTAAFLENFKIENR